MVHVQQTEPENQYLVAVAPGILNDGTYCVVLIDPDYPKREILVECQLENEDAVRLVAQRYREQSSASRLDCSQEIAVLDRTSSRPLLLGGVSEKELEARLRAHLKETLSDLSALSLKKLYKTPFLWSLAAIIVYFFDWRLDIPTWFPFAEEILGSDKLTRLQLAYVLPGALFINYLVQLILQRNHFIKEAIAAEIVTTLACEENWDASRFRDLYVSELSTGRFRGFVRWIVGDAGVGEIESFLAALPREKGNSSPFEFERSAFEKYIHAMIFMRQEPKFSEHAFRIPSPIRLAGDFQDAQLEHHLSFLSKQEQRELRYRVRVAAERFLLRRMRIGSIMLEFPLLFALIWSIWICSTGATWALVINTVISFFLIFKLIPRTTGSPTIPKELFLHQVFWPQAMKFYSKLIRNVPLPNRNRDATPVQVVSELESGPNET